MAIHASLPLYQLEQRKYQVRGRIGMQRNKDLKEKENSREKLEMTAYLVEKIIKKYKSHRGATDFDLVYIDAIVNGMKSGKSGEANRD
jgi:hypothetical protein